MGPRVNSFCSIDLLIWFPFKSPWPEPLLQNTNTCCQSKPHIKIFFFKRISGKRKESFLVSWTLETSVLQFEWVCEDESSMENVTTSVKIPPTWFHFQQLLFRVQYLPGILLYIIMSWGHWGMIYFSKKHTIFTILTVSECYRRHVNICKLKCLRSQTDGNNMWCCLV